MIQRIQSLYMLLWLPIAVLIVALFPVLTVEESVFVQALPGMFALVISSAVLAVFSIFLFKKRNVQLLINRINLLLMLVLFPVLLLWETGWTVEGITFGNAAYLPLPAAILLLLANRAIKKDENLIRSMDRLR
jgi:F0F1-type ATP synthase assembly protein I